MHPLDDTRPGDLLDLDFFGEGHDHYLVIDVVSISSVWKNATIRGCSTVPGFAAAQRQQAKFDADRVSSQPVSRMHGGANTLVPYISWLRMAVGLAARARPGCCNIG